MTTKPQELAARTSNPLPLDVVRDLLGIVRALYAFQRARGNRGNARDLQGAGVGLRRALELVRESGDEQKHAAAWQLADQAIATIARVQGRGSAGDDLTAVVRLASDRVARLRRDRFTLEDRHARRQARIKRG